MTSILLSNATLTLTNGAVLGTSPGSNANPSILYIGGSGKLISTGSPLLRNRLVRYNTVQEQSVTNNANNNVFVHVDSSATTPDLRCRFTDWRALSGAEDHLIGYNVHVPFSFNDCEFTASQVFLKGWPVAFTNCLWESVSVNLNDDEEAVDRFIYNNLFRGGTLTLVRNGSGAAHVRDTLFDRTTIAQTGTITNDHNAYVTNANRLTPDGSGDVILTNAPVFQTSTLGNYYYPTNDGMLSRLINAGSVTNAALAGLYHYTTTTNQVKEANSTNEIGFHYVAVGASGQPLDQEPDGLPDYFEDSNGNGTYESGTDLSNWQNSDTDGDGMPDGWMMSFFGHPLASANDQSRAQDDPDVDGLTNLQEYQLGSRPTQGNRPELSTRPAGKMLQVGETVAFSVVSLSASVGYQWAIGDYFGAFTPIQGATNSSYTRTNVQLSDNGHVKVTVTNAFGSVNSIAALVVPDSPAWSVWTNYIAHTNSKTTTLWSSPISHPTGWPTNASPLMAWNTNCLLYGMTGFTGISQCNGFEGSSGQDPVTAITRRHGFIRGHGNGNGGYQGAPTLPGKKVWFCAADNTVITATVYSSFVRCFNECGTYNNADYGLVLFDQDLDSRIQPVSVMATPSHLVAVFRPCQHGMMSANLPPFLSTSFTGYDDPGLQAFSFNEHPTYQVGDSGSPDLVPLPESNGSTSLVLVGARSSSGVPSQQMEDDMKTLIDNYNSEKGLHPGDPGYLDPTNSVYKLNWHSYP